MNGRSATVASVLCCFVVATAWVGSVGAAPTQPFGPTVGEAEPQLRAPPGDAAAVVATVGGVHAAQNASLVVTESNVSLTVTGATDGDTYDYDLSNPGNATNFSIELTGVETTDTDTVSTDLTPNGRWNLEIAGDARPSGPGGVGNPVIELTARSHSWDSGYTSNDTTGRLFGDGYDSAHTLYSVPANEEIHQLTIGGLVSERGGCADVYVNEDGQNGAYGEGLRVATNFCPSDTGPQTIHFDRPYETSSDNVTIEFVSKIGGPVVVPLEQVSAERDGYETNRGGDAGNSRANITVSTGTPANVSVTDTAGDTISFGSLSDNETVTRSMVLTTRDVLTVEYVANGADLRGTARYQETSRTRNVSVVVNENRTAYQGTLAAGETVSLATDTAWLRSGTNTVTIDIPQPSADAPPRLVDVHYRHGLGSAASVDVGTETTATPASAADTVVTGVAFEQETIQVSEQAVVVVTVRNPQPTADTHRVDLELFGQVVNSREVTVPAEGVTTVRFTHTIVSPGTYTARVDNETARIQVLGPDETPVPTSTTTSTDSPGFGVVAVVLAVALGVALARRQD